MSVRYRLFSGYRPSLRRGRRTHPRCIRTTSVAALLASLLILSCTLSPALSPATSASEPGSTVRWVGAPFFSDEVRWSETGVFWFGEAELKPDRTPPGRNYVDVRVAYTQEHLALFANIVDYFLWYDTGATLASDLTAYDAIAVYLDRSTGAGSAPGEDARMFLAGLCVHDCGDGTRYRREALFRDGAWDEAWNAQWRADTGGDWWDSGPNNNDPEIDFGWRAYLEIPWSSLGLQGPPPADSVWRLGVVLYDRDDRPPAGEVPPQTWPESFAAEDTATWGEVRFSPSSRPRPRASVQGTTVIRRGLGESLVEDTWVGGGGGCAGGHEGNPYEDSHGDGSDLFVANQDLTADFPCYSKTLLRFGLDQVPDGRVIVQATLTLHHWGNSGGPGWEPLPAPSLIQVLVVDNTWDEGSVAWNTAPLARWADTATSVEPVEEFPGWPGVPYHWDVTAAVAEAHAAGAPLSIALYTAATEFHSSKFFTSSETGEWNAAGRPTLTVVWGVANEAIVPRAFLPVLRRR